MHSLALAERVALGRKRKAVQRAEAGMFPKKGNNIAPAMQDKFQWKSIGLDELLLQFRLEGGRARGEI